MTRTLILMRHGKSDYPLGVSDHDRPLAPRGRREAALAGNWLRAELPPIDAVLCSTALRTRETLDATGVEVPVQFCTNLYDADPAEVVAEVGFTDTGVRTLLVVGHFPGVPEAALTLDGGDNTELSDRIRTKFPTSALAVLDVPGDWGDIADTGAALRTFHVPR